jgi:hypothetical protein
MQTLTQVARRGSEGSSLTTCPRMQQMPFVRTKKSIVWYMHTDDVDAN